MKIFRKSVKNTEKKIEKNIKQNTRRGKASDNFSEDINNTKLSSSLRKNLLLLKKIFSNDDTIIFKELSADHNGLKCGLVYSEPMIDSNLLNRDIINPILKHNNEKMIRESQIDYIKNSIISCGDIEKTSNLEKIVTSILYGSALLLVDNTSEVLLIEIIGFKTRNITEPMIESVIRGPRESFVENIIDNISLIKKRLIDSDLKFNFKVIGKRTRTKVCICYLQGLADNKMLDELNERLDGIEIDGVLDSGYIQELIKDSPFSPFKTIGATERPDRVVANILEGRIALIINGSPYVLTLPYLFMENFQMSEDYYTGYVFASINRLLRWVGFFISTSFPAVYVALATFHQEMIPTPLILSISAAREGVPFPTIIEVIIMLLIFEVLREAGARLPAPIGSTIGFVGAVILGEAAITAKFVSAPIVIVAALTGISNFLLPTMLGALNVIRFSLILLAAFMGLYGYVFGVVGLFIHLMSLRTFGMPYMLNIGSVNGKHIKDTIIRAPWRLMRLRPKLIGKDDMIRQK